MVFVYIMLVMRFFTQLSAGESIHKRKLCIEFEISGFKHHGKPIKMSSTLNKHQCLTFCVHERNCSAFNLRMADGACMLLPVSSFPCMSSDTTAISTQNLCRRQLIIHEVCVLDLNRTSFSMATRGSTLGNFG